MSDVSIKLYEALKEYGSFPTLPVGVKMVRTDEKAPEKARYPLRDIGNRMAVCQGLTIARTIGWTMAFKKEDHGCPLSLIFIGHIDPQSFLDGTVSGYYQDDEASAKSMEQTFARWPMGDIKQIWLAPLPKCAFEPTVAVVRAGLRARFNPTSAPTTFPGRENAFLREPRILKYPLPYPIRSLKA